MATEVLTVMPQPQAWTLSSEEEDRVADPDQLQDFALDELQSIPLANLVLDAVMFEKLYHSQRFWLCHFCGSYFSDGDSLTTHLKLDHIPSLAKCQSWPSVQKPDPEFVQRSVSKKAWKPINVEHAIRHFYTLCLHARLLEVDLVELPWSWSDDDPERSKLLSQLEQVLKDLASDENGLSFLSTGPLRYLIAVASRHILVRLPRRDHVLDFTRQLATSPLSFCFLDRESLFHFVQVAERMSQIVLNFSALDKGDSTSCNMTGDSSINYRLFSPLSGGIYIVLGRENCQDQKLSDIPCTGPLQLQSEPPDFLTQLALSSDSCCNELIMDESTPRFYTVYEHMIRMRSDQPLWRSPEAPFKTERSDFKNRQLLNCCSAVTYLEKKRKDYLSQADVFGLKVVEELCKLQSLEFEVRRLCAFDFRSYIVPLMQQFLQMLFQAKLNNHNEFLQNSAGLRCCSSSSKEEKFAAGLGCSDNGGGSFASFSGQTPSSPSIAECGKTEETDNSSLFSSSSRGSSGSGGSSGSSSGGSSGSQTPSSAFKHMNKEYQPNTSLPIAGCGDQETDSSGLFICVYLSDLMDDINFYFETVDAVREAITYHRIHKTWWYWYCYHCQKGFLNRESHMEHMEDKHKLLLPCDGQSRLVPRSPSKHEVDQLLGLRKLWSYLPCDNYHMEKYIILERMKELMYSVLNDKTVPFSGSSHLVHLAEFARDEFFRITSRDEEMLVLARKIDETTQLDFSMYSTRCLRSVWEFLEKLCKQCTSIDVQTHESTYFPDVASCGMFCSGPNLIFDAAKFTEAFSCARKEVEEEENHPFVSNYMAFVDIEKRLQIELKSLEGHFDGKRKVLGELDVVFALDRMLMRESDHAEALWSRVKNLDSMHPAAKDSFHQLISRLLSEASSLSIEEAVRHKKNELLYKLDDLDIKITQELARINKSKREISDLCFWDCRTDILLVIGVFLKTRIRVDGDLTSWASNKLQELLRSIDHRLCFRIFRILSVSIGEVFVNIRDEWGLSFDYKRMRLNFEGEWQSELRGNRTSGHVDFVGSSHQHDRKNEDMKAEATVVLTSGKTFVHELELAPVLRKAICDKLLKFQEAFTEKYDVCMSGHDLVSDCMQDVPLDYPFLNERRLYKERFNEIKDDDEWDSTSSDD